MEHKQTPAHTSPRSAEVPPVSFLAAAISLVFGGRMNGFRQRKAHKAHHDAATAHLKERAKELAALERQSEEWRLPNRSAKARRVLKHGAPWRVQFRGPKSQVVAWDAIESHVARRGHYFRRLANGMLVWG